MNLLTIIEDYGLHPKKVASTKGGEWACACPRCGGDDRFRIHPNHKQGRYFCRYAGSCGTAGDAIQFLIDFQGKTFKEAADYVGKQLEERPQRRRHSQPREEALDQMQACEKLEPEERWRRQATVQVGAAHKTLLENEERLKWLARRGIGIEAAKRFHLGWIEKEVYASMDKWGLPMEKNPSGRSKKVWLPKGYLIPQWNLAGHLTMLQVRMEDLLPNNKMRYYPVKGSTVTPMIISPRPALPPQRTAWVIVESRLDAVLIAFYVGDIVGVIALGNNSANPCPEAIPLLDASPLILNAVDYDEAGKSVYDKWLRRFKKAKSWPVPDGNDPGEYVEKYSGDVREWILAGLPPGLRIERKVQAVQEQTEQSPAPDKQKNKPLYTAVPTGCGREIYLTDSRKAYEQLEAEGKLPFSNKELDISKAFKADGGNPALLVDMKEIFGGRIIERVEL